MIDTALRLLGDRYSVSERDIGSYAQISKGGMRFQIRAYKIESVGYISAVTMSAMLGLMKMETLVCTPLTVDAPLFSYDRIRAMGNDTLLLELYDTQLAPAKLDALDAVQASYARLPDHSLGARWYDHLKLSPSLAKRARHSGADYDSLCASYFSRYMELLAASPQCDRAEKQSRVRAYVNGLLQNGGPSTDQFKKLIGAEKTRALFTRYIFSSEDEPSM